VSRRSVVVALALASAVAGAGCGGGDDDGDNTCADTIGPGDLVITEVFADAEASNGGSAADEGREWFEIYNASTRTIDLTGLELVHSRDDDTMGHTTRLGALSIAAGDYLVLANTAADLVPAYADYGYGDALGDLYNTGTGKVRLRCGTAEVDVASYTDVAPGFSRQLDGGTAPDYTANDDLASWCEATDAAAEFVAANHGTPGAANEDCAHVIPGTCSDNGTSRPTVVPVAGDLVITEVMPNPDAVGDELGEWFEVTATRDVDLNDVGLDRVNDSSDPDVIASEECLALSAGARVVFAKSADPTMNGGLPPVAATFSFSLVGGTSAEPGDVALFAGATLLDQITWTSSPTGATLQVDPDFANAVDNDSEANFCASITPYGAGDLGTPGNANDECTFTPPPGMCDDEGTLRPIVKPVVGDLVLTEVMPSPAAVSDTDGEWFEMRAVNSFDLNELGLDRAGDAGSPELIISATCLRVIDGETIVFARNADPAVNGGVANVAATFGFALVTGPGNVQIVDDDTVIDAITWTTSTSGASLALDPDSFDPAANDVEANFCNGATAYGAGDLGTPGADNPECGATGNTCLDGGTPRPIVPPAAGDLVITEVMPSPSEVSDAVGEWFEIVATAPVDLNGLGLDRAGDASAPNVVTSADCISLAAGQRAVFARSADALVNGGVANVAATFSFALVDAGDVQILAGATVLDAITWSATTAGASHALDPDFVDPTANDLEANFCDGATLYNTIDLGTPGGANAECGPITPPSSCFDTVMMATRPVDAPVAGDLRITEWMPDPTLVSDANGEWIELFAVNAFDLNGVQVGAATLGPSTVTGTDCVPVAAGSHVVFARNTSPAANGGVTAIASMTTNLVNGSGTVQVGIDDVALDTQVYGTSTAGRSFQSDADLTVCVYPGTTLYNTSDRGTPGAGTDAECP
jgi:hypothetical protein